MGHYKRDCPHNLKRSNQVSTFMNMATNSAANTIRENFGVARRGAENKNTDNRGPGAVGRGQSQILQLKVLDLE